MSFESPQLDNEEELEKEEGSSEKFSSSRRPKQAKTSNDSSEGELSAEEEKKKEEILLRIKNSGKEFSGGEHLGKKYPDLRKSEQVKFSHDYSKEKESIPEDTFLKNMEAFYERHRDNESEMNMIREAFHNEYVIKEKDIPETYFQNRQRIARELGHGDVKITDEERKALTEVIIADQKSTLDNWTNYITSPDADVYPSWIKYWAIRSATSLSSYDKEKQVFSKRRKDTVAPFPDLNREALAYVVDVIDKKTKKENIDDTKDNPELEKLIQSENFGKLYAYAIEKVTPTETNELETVEGEWIKYNQNSDHMPLVESLQGHGTGWCTAGESTARTQLGGGDFYVYYSKDKEGNNTIPRVAIRMEGDQIGEVRGISSNQNLDPCMNEIADEKLNEFPDGEKYKKKTHNMEFLTEIEKKQKNGDDLTKEDLIFIYEINNKIEGFGYQKDPRIEEILNQRNGKKDLSSVLNCREDQIAVNQKEALSGNIKYYSKDLNLNDFKSAEGLKLPETINGYLDLRNLQSAEGLKLPETINGYLDLGGLQSAEGLKLPETINGYLDLRNLQSAEGLKLPETINGYLDLGGLQSAEGLKLPETINGYLDLGGLQSAEGLKLPETINGNLYLSGLQSAKGLKLPETINGYLYLSGLQSAEGLKLPETINGYLDLGGLQSAEGLKLPETINGYLYLSGLQSAEGLKLPETINGYLDLGGLQSAKGLKLPETINGSLRLSGLQSAEGLKLPETINGYLDLRNLQSAEGLKLPETINGNLDLGGLQSAEGLKLPETINGYLDLRNLQSAEGLKMPETINGSLRLSGLQSAEGLKLPETINVYLYLDGLQSAKGLKLPKTIKGGVIFNNLKNEEIMELKNRYPNVAIISSLKMTR